MGYDAFSAVTNFSNVTNRTFKPTMSLVAQNAKCIVHYSLPYCTILWKIIVQYSYANGCICNEFQKQNKSELVGIKSYF